MIRLVDYSHRLLEAKTNLALAIDMTCGNGGDTLFLAKIAKKVFGFDVQDIAITNTRLLLEKHGTTNVTLVLDSLENFANYINEPVDVAIYNLGYLPSSDKLIRTDGETVVKSLAALLPMLNTKGIVVIVVYPDNPDEDRQIRQYLSLLDNRFDVIEHRLVNRSSSPYIIEIRKA